MKKADLICSGAFRYPTFCFSARVIPAYLGGAREQHGATVPHRPTPVPLQWMMRIFGTTAQRRLGLMPAPMLARHQGHRRPTANVDPRP